ncbi:MAG: cobalamin B12-binding domain-containing protein [Egibacteraceae bacterium]
MSALSQTAEYLACLERRDLAAAMDVALGALTAGAGTEQVLGMLAGAQREVGERWASNEWTVADEHAATAITDRVAAAVAAHTSEPVLSRPLLVVCAEGEWHTLPARMLTDGLRARRWDAQFLGGSIPARDLQRHLEETRPLAVAVSCAIPMTLPGALETVEAAHRAGVPGIAGGRAFGDDDRRATAIGADAWAADAAATDRVLQGWAEHGPGQLAAPDEAAVASYRTLRGDRTLITEQAEHELERRLPWLRSAEERQRQRTREDLEYTVRFLEATVLTGDERVATEYLSWLLGILTARRVPATVLDPTFDALGVALHAQGQEQAAGLLTRSAASLPANSAT